MPSLIRHPQSGIYYAIVRQNKKQVWKSLRTKNISEASKAYDSYLKMFDPKSQNLLSTQIKEYLNYIGVIRSSKTQEVYRYALDKFTKSVGDKPIFEITVKDMDIYISQNVIKTKNVSLNIQIRAIKAFFNCCKRWQVIQTNPMEEVRQLRVSDKIPSYLNNQELNNLFSKIENDQWLFEIIKFAAYTGTRLGEIAHLEWEHVDLTNKLIHIQSSVNYQVKSGKMRTIPLNDELFEMLSKKNNKEGFVFKGRTGKEKVYPPYVSRQFKKIVIDKGFDKGLHFHSIRHSFASILAQKGVSLHYIQKLLGHSNISVTQIYSHLEPSNLFDSVNMFQVR